MNSRSLAVLQSPDLLKFSDIEELKREITNYPYLQSLRAVYLLSLHKFMPELYKKELAVTAAYTTDKKILYNLVNPKVEVQADEKPDNTEKVKTDSINYNQNFQGKKIRQVFPVMKNREKLSKEELNSETSKSNSPSEEKDKPENNSVENTDQHKDDNFTFNHNFQKPKSIAKEQEPILDNKTKEEQETKKSFAFTTDFFEKKPEETQEENTPEWQPMSASAAVPDSLIKPKNSPKNNDVKETPVALPKEEKVMPEEEVIANNEDNDSNVSTFINTWQNWLHKAKPSDSAADKKEQAIEKFIETNPKISALREDVEYSVHDKGDDISHLITETLANLYAKQKLYTKAISAYKVLQTKFPARQEEFQQKINDLEELNNASE